jgi:hypothetical protein
MRRIPSVTLLASVCMLLTIPAVVQAGMPSIHLTDVAKLRFQNLSFFLMLLLVSAGLIQLLWNYLGKDFTFLPRLTYPKACGVVVLWGLLFVLVLTMISGARELMTPGAWEKQGLTYRLNKNETPAAPEPVPDKAREQQLIQLRAALQDYAQKHQNYFPADQKVPEIAASLWVVPDISGMPYVYVGGLRTDAGKRPLAYEPGLFGSKRFVLLADGEIKKMAFSELEPLLKGKP